MRILIVSLDNLGDCVMAAGLARALKKASPENDYSVWTKSYSKGVFDFAEIAEVFACDPFWDGSPAHGSGTFYAYAATLRQIRGKKFDCALILHTDWRKALSCAAAGIPLLAGFRQKKSSLFLNLAVPPVSADEHSLDALKRLAESFLGRPVGDIVCRLEMNKDYVSFVEKAKARFPGTWVAVHPVSGDESRNWPLERWLDLSARMLGGTGDFLLWVVGSGRDSAEIRRFFDPLKKNYSGRVVYTWEEARDAGSLAALLSGMSFFAGNDSGPLHIASAFGVPSVGLFKNPKQVNFRPRGAFPSAVLSADDMRQISTRTVFAFFSENFPRRRTENAYS